MFIYVCLSRFPGLGGQATCSKGVFGSARKLSVNSWHRKRHKCATTFN